MMGMELLLKSSLGMNDDQFAKTKADFVTLAQSLPQLIPIVENFDRRLSSIEASQAQILGHIIALNGVSHGD